MSRVRLAALLVLVLFATIACGGDAPDTSGDAPADGETAAAGGDVSTYNIAWLSDFSGPYADVWPDVQKAHEAVQTWWNETKGAEIGVELQGKTYDHRYDPAQVASLWPGILSELNPIGALGVGGPDVAALQERLPDDKVGLYQSTAGYGYAWQPDPWVFNPRPTYGHEAAGFLEWYKEEQGLDELKFGSISSEASPAYVDIVEGSQAWAEDTDGFDFVGVEYAEVQPADLSREVRTLVQEGAQVILTQTNTAAALLAVQALQSQGHEDVVTMVSSHNSLTASGEAAGDLSLFNGMYEAYSMAIPAEESGPAFDFYQMLVDDYGLDAEWDVPTVQGLEQQIYFLRIVERAVEEVGAENLTGEAVRNAAVNASIPQDELFNLLPELNFTNEAPFPTENLTVNIGTVVDGQYTLAEEGYPIPPFEKY